MKKLQKRLQFYTGNNKGVSFVTVLIVLTLIAVLGVMSLSVAMMNARMRALSNQQSQKFYENETSVQEIYEGVGMLASTELGKAYASVRNGMSAHSKSAGESLNISLNSEMKDTFWASFLSELSEGGPVPEQFTADRESMNGLIDGMQSRMVAFATSAKAANDTVEVTIQNAYVSKALPVLNGENNKTISGASNTYNELTLEDVTITRTAEDGSVASSITLDMHVKVPDLRFVNRTTDLFSYSIVSNQDISFAGNIEVEGSLFGGLPTDRETGHSISFLNASKGVLYSPYIIAATDVDLEPGAELTIDGTNTNAMPEVWATDITLKQGNNLTTANTGIYLLNDLIMKGNQDKVDLGGRYFGYGNAGVNHPDQSSAMIIEGMNSTLNLTNLDSLVLAGRVHLRVSKDRLFREGEQVYSLGQSIGVLASQMIYLVPPEDLLIGSGDDAQSPTSNPIEGGNISGLRYVGREENGDTFNLLKESEPIKVMTDGSRSYVFYNFKDIDDKTGVDPRRMFLYNYLQNSDNANYFNSLLQYQFGMLGEGSALESVGIWMNTDKGGNNTISSAGDLYTINDGRHFDSDPDTATSEEGSEEAAPKDYDQNIFDLVMMDNEGITAGSYADLTYTQMSEYLKKDYANLLAGLSKEKQDLLDNTDEAMQPLSNFINFAQLSTDDIREAGSEQSKNAKDIAAKENIPGHVVVYNSNNVDVHVDGTNVTISASGKKDEITDGQGILLICRGKVNIDGSGTFSGCILAGGTVTVSAGSASDPTGSLKFVNRMTDPAVFDADGLLKIEQISSGDSDKEKTKKLEKNATLPGSYLYDYAGTSGSDVIRNYTDFVTVDHYRKADGNR